jgi:DNA polymerase-3 subunit alpha
MRGIKNVGDTALEEIIEERKKNGKFKTMLDLCSRINLRVCNKRVLEGLIYSGSLDSLDGNRAQKIAELDKIIAISTEIKKNKKTGQKSLFDSLGSGKSSSCATNDGNDATSKNLFYNYEQRPEFDDKKKLALEKEYIGLYIKDHPIEKDRLAQVLERETIESLASKQGEGKNIKKVHTLFVYKNSHKIINTKSGKRMAFLQIEDETGRAELVVFPSILEKTEKAVDDFRAVEQHVIGNGMRLDSTSRIELDARWKSVLTSQQLAVFDQISGDRNRRYGYV